MQKREERRVKNKKNEEGVGKRKGGIKENIYCIGKRKKERRIKQEVRKNKKRRKEGVSKRNNCMIQKKKQEGKAKKGKFGKGK